MSLLTTARDVHTLRAIFPRGDPHPPDALALLYRMFCFCQRDSVRQFLFTTSPAHLTVMTSPSFRASAILVRTKEDSFAPTASTHFRTTNGGSVSFCVPAFSIQNTTLGFGVSETDRQPNSLHDDSMLGTGFWGRNIFTFRSAVDTTDGSYLLVADADQEIHVIWVVQVSPNLRQKCEARFSKAAAHSIISSSSPPSYEQILNSLTHNIVMNEYRDCPFCGSLPSSPCLCPTTDLSPQHPLDFSHCKKIMSLHSGNYESIARHTGYINGSGYTEYARGLRRQIARISSPETANRLLQWAVSEYLKPMSVDPMTSLLPDTFVTTQDPYSVKSSHHLPSPAGFESSPFADKLKSLEAIVEHNPAQDATTSTSPTQVDVEVSTQSSPSVNAAIEECLRINFGSTTSNFIRASNSSKHSSLKPTTCGADAGGDVETDLLSANPHQDFQTATSVILQTTEQPQRKPYRSYRRRRGVSPDDPEEIRRREEYRVMRREKNRASARRSNLKRKLENDSRRRELESLREMEDSLREREKQLRLQNMRLRQAIADHG